jgi:alkane 1-monooxygenase
MKQALTFTIASFAPVPLILASVFWGGGWSLAAALYLTFFAFALDELVALAAEPGDGREFPAATALLVALALGHFAVFGTVVWALSGGVEMSRGEWIATFSAAMVFFSQVSNSNAHELIHRPQKWLFWLGTWVYITQLCGHHSSAHPKIHHRYVGSRQDPNTPRMGESFYRFAGRACRRSFLAGMRLETELRRTRRRGLHPYAWYVGGGLACMAAALAVGGLKGLAIYLSLALLAQFGLLMSDYIQHYGLYRARLDNGKLEPIGPQHSWNAPQWFSSAAMLNGTRHSDHHAHPMKPFYMLEAAPDPDLSPMLPYSAPAMAAIAMVPRLWYRKMNHRAAFWQRRTNGLKVAAE